MHIQYFCTAGITRSVMAKSLSSLIEPDLDFSATGILAKTCFDLSTPDRISYIAQTALEFLQNFSDSSNYRNASNYRAIVEGISKELDLENLDMKKFESDPNYESNIRDGLIELLREGLAPNEVELRNIALNEFGAQAPIMTNIQLLQRDDVDLYLGMNPSLIEGTSGILSTGPSFIGDYSGVNIEEPNGNLFSSTNPQDYINYAKTLHDRVLPQVISTFNANL